MQWFEPLIAIAAIAVVVVPIIVFFMKKKKGTLTCECGKPMSSCTGDCNSCKVDKDALLKNYNKSKCHSNSYVYRIEVEGMMCGMCESHINDAIRKKFNDIKVFSSKNKGETLVTSKSVLNITDLRTTVEETGYKVGSIKLL